MLLWWTKHALVTRICLNSVSSLGLAHGLTHTCHTCHMSYMLDCHSQLTYQQHDVLQYEYLWADGVKVKKPTRLSAPEYINNLFDWIESQASQTAGRHMCKLHEKLKAHCFVH